MIVSAPRTLAVLAAVSVLLGSPPSASAIDVNSELTAFEGQFDYLGNERINQVQTFLKDRGYYSGRIDGDYGPGTRKGLKDCIEQGECLATHVMVDGHRMSIIESTTDGTPVVLPPGCEGKVVVTKRYKKDLNSRRARKHWGTDFAFRGKYTPGGSPVVSPGNGIIGHIDRSYDIKHGMLGRKSQNGNSVSIYTEIGPVSVVHLRWVNPDLKQGDEIFAGDPIGVEGRSASYRINNPHTHVQTFAGVKKLVIRTRRFDGVDYVVYVPPKKFTTSNPFDQVIDARPDLADVLVLSTAANTADAQEKYREQLNRGRILGVPYPLDCAL